MLICSFSIFRNIYFSDFFYDRSIWNNLRYFFFLQHWGFNTLCANLLFQHLLVALSVSLFSLRNKPSLGSHTLGASKILRMICLAVKCLLDTNKQTNL